MKTLVNSGFAFLKELNNGEILMENKFTGLRLIFNENTKKYRVVED